MSTPNAVNQPEQESARLLQSPALWLLASAAATFYLSKVIDGKGLMLLSSLLVYKLSQWPATSLWSMISVMVVACYRPALALWLGAMVATAAGLFKTSALELIRLQYPLYYGIVRIPKVMADWILHNASLTSYVNSTLAWGPWVLFSLAVCLQCAIWIASIMHIQRPQQSASHSPHGLTERHDVSSKSFGMPAPGAGAAAAAASVTTAAAPAPVSDADTPISAATSPPSGTLEESRAGTGAASATAETPTAAATATAPEAATDQVLSIDSDGNLDEYRRKQEWNQRFETFIQAEMAGVPYNKDWTDSFNQVVHKWNTSVAPREIQDEASGQQEQEPQHAQGTHNWLLTHSPGKPKASKGDDVNLIAALQEKLLQRGSEVCNLQQALEALAIERDCLQDKLKAAASQHEAAMTEQHSKAAAAVQKAAGNGLQEAKQRAEALQAKLQKAQEHQASLEQQNVALDKQLAAAKDSEAARRLRDANHINMLQADWDDGVEERCSLQKQLESLESDLMQALASSKHADSLQLQIESLESDLRHTQASSKHADSLQLEVDSLQEQLTAAIAQLSDSAAQIDSLQKQLTAAKGKVTENAAKGQGQATHQAEVWAAQQKALNKHIRELQAAQAKAAEHRAAHAAQLDDANAGITAAQHALRQTEQKYVTTAFALDKAQAGLKETHTQLAQAQAELQDTHTQHDVILAQLKDTLLRQVEAAELQAAADSTAKAEALSKLSKVEVQKATEVSRTQELQRRVQELVAQAAKDQGSKAEALAQLHRAELQAAEEISQLQHRVQQAEKQAEEEVSRSLELSNHVREFAAQSAADHDRAKDAERRLEEVRAKLTEERDRVPELQRRVQRFQQQATADRAQQQDLARAVVVLEDKLAERDRLQGLLEEQASEAAKTDVSNNAADQELPKKAASPIKDSDADFWDLPHPGVSPDWKGPANQLAQATPLNESATVEVAETGKEVKAKAVEPATEAAGTKGPSLSQLSPELAAEWDYACNRPAKALGDTMWWYMPKDVKQPGKPIAPSTAAVIVSESVDDGEGEVEVVIEGQGSVNNAGAGNGIKPGQDKAQQGFNADPVVNWLLDDKPDAPVAEGSCIDSDDGAVEVFVHKDLLP